jgi:hypothetical protein
MRLRWARNVGREGGDEECTQNFGGEDIDNMGQSHTFKFRLGKMLSPFNGAIQFLLLN